jgi:cna protein B-type domain protein
MNFDYAGNLICSGAKLGVYSIPTAENLTTTPARKALTVVKTANATAVENVETVTEVSADFAGDLLIVQAPETVKSVVVFAADGTRVAEGRNAQLTVNAPAGVYLVKVNNFKAVKAMKN